MPVACHSLVRSLPAGLDTATMRANLGTLAERHPLLRDVRLFDESLHVGSTDPIAVTRRAREARRAVSGAVARAVVLRYADRAADLVLVAHRGFVDRRALDQLAAGLVIPAGSMALPEPVARHEVQTTVTWGLGNPAKGGRTGTVGLATTATGGDATPLLVAATAVVLARYGAPAEFELITAGPAVATARRPVALAVDDSTTAADLLDAATHAGDPVSAKPAAVGVLVSVGRAGEEYHPALAPIFPVTLAWEHSTDGGLRGALHYDEGALHPVIARQFARHVDRAVAALGHTKGLVGDIELVDAGEAAVIVAAGRTPVRDQFTVESIHELFRSVAAAQPDATALSDSDRTLSYAELDAESDAVAGALRARGVVPGDRVGVCLDRDADLVVVLLGVLKAGAAYVPMDPAYPAERLVYTVTDAGVRLVIATSFPDVAGVTILCPAELSTVDDRPIAGVGDIAYVIYTSGSTGRPKGVAVPHRNVAALLAVTTTDMGLGPSDTWTLFHSSAFDFSVWEIWGALLSGGHLVVVPYFTSRDPEAFHDLLVLHQVTVLNQTPSAFAALKEVDPRRAADLAVRLVIFGGEPLDTRILRDWFRRHPHTRCRVVNMFGITETTVHVTSQTVTPLDVSTGSRSVGRALPGWSVSVRDAAGRVQPFGVPGEIYVGGAGVASGYLNADELTAEKIGLEQDFFEIGGTSLAAMRVATALSDLVTLRDVLRCSRLAELIAAAERESTEDGKVLVRLTDEIADPLATVVCLPYAGGNAVHFKPVADAVARLTGRLAVVAVELPGHAPGSTVDDLRSLRDTAELVAAEIGRTVTGPVVLWGHCNGSTLAIELARLLTERDHQVRHLFLAAMLVGTAEEIRKTLRDTETLTFADIQQYLAEWTGTAELDGIGSDFEDLVTRAFRHDALRANEFLLAGLTSDTREPLTTPCIVVMSSDDKLTVGYQSGYREWGLFVKHPALHEIDGGGHYFTRTRPEQVAELIARFV